MKKLSVSFEGVHDPTGLLHSFAKCLSAAVLHSPYAAHAQDIVAASGFAFRIWVDRQTLCPSAMSMWEFKRQKPWVESGGFSCEYVERLWGQDAIEEERRLAAIDQIRASIDRGIAAIVWDPGNAEWGLVTGYDDGAQRFCTLLSHGAEDTLDYTELGKKDIPILSVLTITGRSDKPADAIHRDTLAIAAAHLRGAEWCENASGLEGYPAMIDFIRHRITDDTWSLSYYLGNYAGLRYYAWQFFEAHGPAALAALYRRSYEAWQAAFDCKKTGDLASRPVLDQVAAYLETAHRCELEALTLMEG